MATEAGANRNVIVEFDRIWQQSISNTVKYCRGFKKDHPWKGCLIDAASSPKQIRSYLNRALIPNRSEYWLLRTPSYPIFSRIIFCSLEQALQGAPPILQEATANKWLIQLVLEKAKEPEIKLPTSAGSWKKQEFQKNIYFCFIDYVKAFDCVVHNKLWKILKEMGIPDHLTCLLRNLYASQE